MNQLCWYVEDIDFDLKFFKNGKDDDFDYRILMNDNIIVDKNSSTFKKILNIMKKYHHIYEMNTHERNSLIEDYNVQYEEFEDDIDEEYSILFREIENELFAVCSNRYELCNYVIYIMYNNFKNKSKAIMWNICGKEIVNNLKDRFKVAYFPVESDREHGVKYLDKYYELKEVKLDNI